MTQIGIFCEYSPEIGAEGDDGFETLRKTVAAEDRGIVGGGLHSAQSGGSIVAVALVRTETNEIPHFSVEASVFPFGKRM